MVISSMEKSTSIIQMSGYINSIDKKEAVPSNLVMLFYTWSIPRYTLRYYSLVCVQNHLFILGIGTIFHKELELIFRSECSYRSYRTCVYN